MDVISVIATLISALSVIVAIGALWSQARQNNLTLSANILRDIEKDFLWSDRMKQRRLVLSMFLLNDHNKNSIPAEVGDMLDWLDQLGLYNRKNIIELEMTWVTLFYWFSHYWNHLKDYADKFEDEVGGIKYYQNARIIYYKLYKFGQKHKKLPAEHVYFSKERLQAFLIEEIEQCSNNQAYKQ